MTTWRFKKFGLGCLSEIPPTTESGALSKAIVNRGRMSEAGPISAWVKDDRVTEGMSIGFRTGGPDEEATWADAYLAHGIVGPGSRSDAMHVALATIGRVDVLVSWSFKGIVNLGRVRLFNAVNLEQGYGLVEIRTPREVLADEESL